MNVLNVWIYVSVLRSSFNVVRFYALSSFYYIHSISNLQKSNHKFRGNRYTLFCVVWHYCITINNRVMCNSPKEKKLPIVYLHPVDNKS